MKNKKELIVKDRHGVEHNLYDLPKNFVFDGNIDLSERNLRELPDLSTVTVTGSFDCWACSNLTSLKGAPKEVGGDFCCSACEKLTSLEGVPQKVGRNFKCACCTKLTSLEGAPKEINGDFICYG